MACSTCYEVMIPECPGDITVKAQLEPSSTFFVTITDKFGTKYTQEVESDADGSFVIDVSLLPAGIFNRHAGNFTIEVRATLSNCDLEDMTFCIDSIETVFTCIIMSFYQYEKALLEHDEEDPAPDALETIIGCECPEEV